MSHIHKYKIHIFSLLVFVSAFGAPASAWAGKEEDRLVKNLETKAQDILGHGTKTPTSEDYKSALQIYNQLIKLYPDRVKYYAGVNARADCLMELKRYAEALKDYNKAIELDPAESYYYYQRSKVWQYISLSGDEVDMESHTPNFPEEENSGRRTIQDLEKAVSLGGRYHSNLADAYLNMAVVYKKMGNRKRVKEFCGKYKRQVKIAIAREGSYTGLYPDPPICNEH